MKYLSLIIVLIFSLSAHAATFTVTRNDDRNATCISGDCSLREAVNAANSQLSNDVINFSAISKITLTNEIAINNNGSLLINGNGADIFTIDGGGTSRIFSINNAQAEIRDIKLTGGNGFGEFYSSLGGAILAQGGSVTLNRIYVIGNSAQSTGGVILVNGTHSILNSTLSGNSSNNSCAGLYNSGGVLEVTNSTISDNTNVNFSSSNVGAGLCSVNGATTLRNVTVTKNKSSYGGGIFIRNGSFNFGNTIVSGNIATAGLTSEFHLFDSNVTVTSLGNNLIGDSAGDANNTNNPISYQPSDILDTPPQLGQLQNNGGTTPTHALLSGSPAIDKGNNSNSPGPTDQRGFARINNGIIDIGAFESGSQNPPPPTCQFSITPNTQDFPTNGGQGTVTITGQANCTYSSLSNNDFITITNGANGSGNGVLTFSVAANSGAARTGTLFIAGQTFTVNQMGTKSRKRVRIVF
jgi:CSLREA domain-containing protein